MADKKAKKKESEEQLEEETKEEVPVEEEVVEEEVIEGLPVPDAPEELDEAARVLGMRGEKLLGFITPAQRGEIKLVIAAEIAKEAAEEAAVKDRARLVKIEQGKQRKQAKRLTAGAEERAAEGHGPLDYPYAATGYGKGSGEGPGGGCSNCGGK